MKKRILFTVILVLFTFVSGFSQCAMCRATVGSNLSEGRDAVGIGLNFGIVYLLLIPYILVSTGVFFFLRSARQRIEEEKLIN